MTFTLASKTQKDRLYSLLRQMAVDGIRNRTGLTPEIIELPSLSMAVASQYISDINTEINQAVRLRRDAR